MKKLSYILSGLLIAGSSAFFSSCGDNKDFWGPHTLTDDEIAEMERQEEILNLVTEICEHDFEFETFLDATDYFRKLINLCKQWNYSLYKSEQYEDFKKQILAMLNS